MIKRIIQFFAGLITYINVSRNIELGQLREREANRQEFEKRKKVINEARNNVVNIDDRIKWLRNNQDK